MAGKHPHLPGLSRLVGGITSGIFVCLRLIFLQGADCTTRQRVTPTSLKNLLQLAENVILARENGHEETAAAILPLIFPESGYCAAVCTYAPVSAAPVWEPWTETLWEQFL